MAFGNRIHESDEVSESNSFQEEDPQRYLASSVSNEEYYGEPDDNELVESDVYDSAPDVPSRSIDIGFFGRSAYRDGAEFGQNRFVDLLEIPKKYTTNPAALLEFLRDDIIQTTAIHTPFGEKPLLIADMLSFARPLGCIEGAIQRYVLQHYAPTDTVSINNVGMTSVCRGLMEESKSVIKSGFYVNPEQYDAVFTRVTSRTFVQHVVEQIDLWTPEPGYIRNGVEVPVLLVSAAEEITNIQHWNKLGYRVIQIGLDERGAISIGFLHDILEAHVSSTTLIGYFPAACKTIGVVNPVIELVRTFHSHRRLVFFDYTDAINFTEMRIALPHDEESFADGVFASVSNTLGGVGASSVILLSRTMDIPELIGEQDNQVVQRDVTATYFEAVGEQPDVVSACRSGFVFAIRGLLSETEIKTRHDAISKRMQKYLTRRNKQEQLVFLGDGYSEKLPFISFIVKDPESRKVLHHGFVSRLLLDMFGIQSWSGYSTAADKHVELLQLGISRQTGLVDTFATPRIEDHAQMYASGRQVSDDVVMINPGFTRITLSYLHRDVELQYLLDALFYVAETGYRFMPLYRPNEDCTDWELDPRVRAERCELIPSRVHARKRRLDIRTCISTANSKLKQYWSTFDVNDIALLLRGRDGRFESPEDILEPNSDGMIGFYYSRDDANCYIIQNKEIENKIKLVHSKSDRQPIWASLQKRLSLRKPSFQ